MVIPVAMTGAAALRIVPTDPTPPYEQLRRQLADLVGAGVARLR